MGVFIQDANTRRSIVPVHRSACGVADNLFRLAQYDCTFTNPALNVWRCMQCLSSLSLPTTRWPQCGVLRGTPLQCKPLISALVGLFSSPPDTAFCNPMYHNPGIDACDSQRNLLWRSPPSSDGSSDSTHNALQPVRSSVCKHAAESVVVFMPSRRCLANYCTAAQPLQCSGRGPAAQHSTGALDGHTATMGARQYARQIWHWCAACISRGIARRFSISLCQHWPRLLARTRHSW